MLKLISETVQCPSFKMVGPPTHLPPPPHAPVWAQKQQNSRTKSELHTFYPLPPAADICHFKWDGLLYVAANQGFVSSGYIYTHWRYTICEECQIFGTDVWNCHLIVYLSLADTQTESISRKWLKDLTGINVKLTVTAKHSLLLIFFISKVGE